MPLQNHYDTLCLSQNASLPVIKAAYKALVLIYHPDKTVHLSAFERVECSTNFRMVQEAYDVLGDPTLKATFDAALQRSKQVVTAPTFSTNGPRTPAPPTKPHCRPTVRLTTPEMKKAMKAKADAQLAQIRQDRAKRNQENASLDIAGLKHFLSIWREMLKNPLLESHLRAHCQIRCREFEEMIAQREARQADWLRNLSNPKSPNSKTATPKTATPGSRTAGIPRKTTPAQRRGDDTRAGAQAPKPAPTKTEPNEPSARMRKSVREAQEKMRADERAQRAKERMNEKARREAAAKERQKAKFASVRAEKEMLKQKANEAAQVQAEKIAKGRAKAGVAPKGDVTGDTPNYRDSSEKTNKPRI